MSATPGLDALAAEQQRRPFVSSVSSQGASFREFRPLAPLEPPVPALPSELLPGSFRPWIEDASERMQIPLECIAIPAIVAVASVISGKVTIQPKARDDGWQVTPNLWGGVVAPPSRLKSPAIAEALAPIKRLQDEAREAHSQQSATSRARVDTCEEKVRALKRLLGRVHEGKEEQSPASLEVDLASAIEELEQAKTENKELRYTVGDTTTEKLGELLALNPDGLLLVRDELAGWLASLEKDSRKGDREFYLESWNGDGSYTYDRITRGTVHIPRLCVSIVGGIQPGKFAKYVSGAVDGGYAADGLLQRFQLLVWPDFGRKWQLVDREPDHRAREAVFRVFQILANLNRELQVARFDTQAQALFFEWLTELEKRLRDPSMDDKPAFQSHLAKYRSLMPSLALVLHLSEGAQPSERVSLQCARRAAAWCEVLEEHARKVFTPELDGGLTAAHALASKIRKKAICDGDSIRDVYRNCWRHLKKTEQVTEGFAVLENCGWVALEMERSGEKGGRPPSEVVTINPMALEEVEK